MNPLDQLYARWNGKFPDYDGYYGSQCWDLAQYYNDIIGGSRWYGDAKDIYNQPGDKYIQIPNSPDAIPQKGDVVVWGAPYGRYIDDNGRVQYAGHVAMGTGEGDTNWFNAFGVNWPTGSSAHVQRHNYDGVIGWLRPKQLIVQGGGAGMLTNDQKKQLFNIYLGRDPEDYGQISELDFFRAAGAEVSAIRAAQQQNIRDLQSRVTQLEKVVTDAQKLIEKQSKELEDAGAMKGTLEKQVEALNKKIDALSTGDQKPSIDGYSLGELLSAAFQKLFKIK